MRNLQNQNECIKQSTFCCRHRAIGHPSKCVFLNKPGKSLIKPGFDFLNMLSENKTILGSLTD